MATPLIFDEDTIREFLIRLRNGGISLARSCEDGGYYTPSMVEVTQLLLELNDYRAYAEALKVQLASARQEGK